MWIAVEFAAFVGFGVDRHVPPGWSGGGGGGSVSRRSRLLVLLSLFSCLSAFHRIFDSFAIA